MTYTVHVLIENTFKINLSIDELESILSQRLDYRICSGYNELCL